ncbi:hypothetical protein BU23DRAFT_83476 [Bimuria novae-zelandiae CBS 107.79]|uniref:Uncharacterized protein n=1 Tax=Bimuria novae-zelandiae CBS 107.79 TaxID=1447943 RepID=A0A6A5UI76_9PLEO|nr:hypothetical protein BU23DRAFT_83476 [Bimuria novae-zelandiae CBS 107.79]
MHASLILLVASLATSAVAAPVPVVAPFESPESLMVREVEVLKREILERLEAIAKRSTPQGYEGEVYDKRDVSTALQPWANDKRSDHSLAVGDEPVHDKRDGGYPPVFAPSANEKRDSGYPVFAPSANDKRDDGYPVFAPLANDKRDSGYPVFAPSANDKRDEGYPIFAPSANDKRDSDDELVSSDASDE